MTANNMRKTRRVCAREDASAAKKRSDVKWRASLLVLGLVASGPALCDCKVLESAELAVVVEHNRPLINGEINGKKVRILANTGSEVSLIWRSEAARLGLHLLDRPGVSLAINGAPIGAQHAVVKQLTIGKFTLHDVDLLVAGELKSPPSGSTMVLGENFFSHYTTEFDLGHGMIRVMHVSGCLPQQLVYWSKTHSLAKLTRSPTENARIEAEVSLNGTVARATIDSGAVTSVVTTAAAARAKVTPETPGVTGGGAVGGIGRKTMPSLIGTFDTFALGDEQIHNATLRIADLWVNSTYSSASRIPDTLEGLPSMLIGADFLLSHRLIVPEGGRVIVFTYVGGPVFQTIHEELQPAGEPRAGP
jgi:predicted aspartyl protease